jgi:hypothetical protein
MRKSACAAITLVRTRRKAQFSQSVSGAGGRDGLFTLIPRG